MEIPVLLRTVKEIELVKPLIKFGLFLLAALSVALLPGLARADIYVTLNTPVSSECWNDPFGSIWNASISDSTGSIVQYPNALAMCTGDLNILQIWTLTGPYASYSVLSSPFPSDPGYYDYAHPPVTDPPTPIYPTLPGFIPSTTGSRTPDVQAKVAFLLDQMYNVQVPPLNSQGLTLDDWIGCKANALCGAVRTLWDGLIFSPSVSDPPTSPLDASIQWADYNTYMAAVTNITAANYTSSNGLWLTDANNDQIIFAEFEPPDPLPPDPIAAPEPSTFIVWSVLGGLGIALACRRQWKPAQVGAPLSK